MKTGIHLMLSDARGVYIPRDFVQGINLEVWQGISAWAREACDKGPDDNPDYWDAWSDILDNAKRIDADGNSWFLLQDGDLWVYCVELMTIREKLDFGFDVDWIAEAETAIENETDEAYDYCHSVGQIFENVSHMTWFRKGLADYLKTESE